MLKDIKLVNKYTKKQLTFGGKRFPVLCLHEDVDAH